MMITSNSKLTARATFYRLRTVAICLALIPLGLTFGALEAAKAQPRVRTYSQADVERLIRDVEQDSVDFQRDFDAWLDRSRLDGRPREDRYNRRVQELTSALRTLRSNFDSRNDWWLARSDMQRVLNEATQLNRLMNSREVGVLNRQWVRLRRNLNRLADAFNLPQVGSTLTVNRPSFPDQGGNLRSCTTTGTFRGWTNTGESELTISRNGDATIRSINSNALYTGRCANDILYFDWGVFNIVRDGRGLSTVEVGNTRNRTAYRRTSGDREQIVPGFPVQGFPDQVGSVPNWAIGRFRGMTDTGESELTITANGAATVRSLSSNELHYGRYANDTLTFDWGSFRVVREGSGIRTVEVGNRQQRTSYRRVD